MALHIYILFYFFNALENHCICVCACMRVYVCVHVCVFSLSLSLSIYIYIYIYTHTHIYIWILHHRHLTLCFDNAWREYFDHALPWLVQHIILKTMTLFTKEGYLIKNISYYSKLSNSSENYHGVEKWAGSSDFNSSWMSWSSSGSLHLLLSWLLAGWSVGVPDIPLSTLTSCPYVSRYGNGPKASASPTMLEMGKFGPLPRHTVSVFYQDPNVICRHIKIEKSLSQA
jgi:hypothetical protein